ncbi:hypothetical protein K438DRAFT_1818656 [Mycena galopus ATCC 62051]|nr:hypothetical protein K438DRAFT_1818656 [Mycena galopus ATCC 62051]
MNIPLLANPDFCGTSRIASWHAQADRLAPLKSLVTLKSLRRALTVKRPKQQPPSLIFSLPAEMLAEMFLQAVADDQDPSARLYPMHSHFVLTQVCGLWRAVALHTPSFWCRIVLHLGGRITGFDKITNLAKTCFERSRELPVALIITSSIREAYKIPNLCMDLVLPVRHRIRHLELKLPAVFVESIYKLPRNSLKALRSISVSALVSNDYDGPWFRSMSALEGAPLLESVELRRSYHPGSVTEWQPPRPKFDPYFAGLPWGRLTDLVIQGLDIPNEDAMYALEMTSSLQRCTLDLGTMLPFPIIPPPAVPVTLAPTNTAPPKPGKLVTLPGLRTLELGFNGNEHTAAEFFDRLILPCLKELSIICTDPQLLPCAILTGLQTRSSFSLHRFALASRTGDSLLPFLESNPLLSRLQLAFCDLELAPLAKSLTRNPEPGGSTLLPRLRVLSLADRWTEQTPPATWALATKAVIKMIRSRRRVQDGGSLLDGFTFGSSPRLSAKKVARLDRLRTEGMRICTVPIPRDRARSTGADYINYVLWQDDS